MPGPVTGAPGGPRLSLSTDDREEPMIAPSTIEELSEHLGEVGASDWQPVTQ